MINPEQFNTDDKYFSDTTHMTVSRYKRMSECELDGMRDFTFKSEALMIGSFVDSYISGELEEFKRDNPEIFSSRGKTKGELKVGFKKAQEICEFIDNDKVFSQFMQGDKQTVFTGEIEGVPFKSKLDIYAKGIAINDLKVMRSITDRSGNYYDFITEWGYDIQGAVYQELCYQNTGERLPFYICVATKEDVINSAIIHIPQEVLDQSLLEVKQNVKHYYDVWQNLEPVNGCGKCKTCISSRNSTPIISLDDIQIGGI